MAHSLKRVLFWLSGAGTETLEQCPNWEQRKYVAFGATVLVPCAFAFIACSYALSTLVDDPLIIYPVATVWALIILTIDRALLAGYRPYLSRFRKLSPFSSIQAHSWFQPSRSPPKLLEITQIRIDSLPFPAKTRPPQPPSWPIPQTTLSGSLSPKEAFRTRPSSSSRRPATTSTRPTADCARPPTTASSIST